MQLIGQENNLELVNKWKAFPQFLILTGEEHTGKTYFLLSLCEKFNLYYYKMDNSISSIRKLLDIMKPNSNVVYHFKDFHKASIQAKNALLKITEEPVEGNYIVITGSSQIKTLESRSKKLIMQPYTKKDVVEYMKNQFKIELDYEELYNMGINTPAKVSLYKDIELLPQLVKTVKTTFDKITFISPMDIIRIIGYFEIKYDDIDLAVLFLEMLIKYIECNIIERASYSYYNILEILLETKRELKRDKTLNRKMALFRAFYDIYKDIESNKAENVIR